MTNLSATGLPALARTNGMKPDPILEQLWKTKDDLARESGEDSRKFFENLRRWEADHLHPGRIIHNADELRQIIAEAERQRESSLSMLNETPPPESRD